jgi:hypothetical protein
LLALAVLLLSASARQPSARPPLHAAGLLLGFSALRARSRRPLVGSWPRSWPGAGTPARQALPKLEIKAAATVLAGGLAVILPWTARNVSSWASTS